MALVVGTSACTGPAPVYVDERFTAAEAVEIQAAADFWPAATGGWLNVDLVFGADVRTRGGDSRKLMIRRTEADIAAGIASPVFAELGFGGFCDHMRSPLERIEIAAERLGSDPPGSGTGGFRATVSHELGHHFGLAHVAVPGSLMSAGAFSVKAQLDHVVEQCLTAADARELCRTNGCAPAVRICEDGL